MTNGMYPELITRPDIKIFLPPIGGMTIYIWGDPDTIPDEDVELVSLLPIIYNLYGTIVYPRLNNVQLNSCAPYLSCLQDMSCS